MSRKPERILIGQVFKFANSPEPPTLSARRMPAVLTRSVARVSVGGDDYRGENKPTSLPEFDVVTARLRALESGGERDDDLIVKNPLTRATVGLGRHAPDAHRDAFWQPAVTQWPWTRDHSHAGGLFGWGGVKTAHRLSESPKPHASVEREKKGRGRRAPSSQSLSCLACVSS